MQVDAPPESAAQVNNPLIKLEYEWWLIAWRLVFPNGACFIMFFMIAFFWAPHKPGFIYSLSQMIAIFAMLAVMLLTLDMLLMKEFMLFNDRVVKTFRIFGNVEVYLNNNVGIRLISYIWGKTIDIGWGHNVGFAAAWRGLEGVKRMSMRLDCNLISNGSLTNFKNACESIGIRLSP